MRTLERDSKAFQIDRIKKIAHVLVPNCEVDFDDHAGSLIRYRIDDQFGTILVLSGYDLPSVIADSSDEELRRHMRALGNGKV